MIWLPGVLSQGGKKLPTWAVYEIEYGAVKSSSGSLKIDSSYKKKVGSGYSISASGTFSLTGASTKTMADIAVGNYLVDIANSAINTATTGSKLYKVTGITPPPWTIQRTLTSNISTLTSVYVWGDIYQDKDTGLFSFSAGYGQWINVVDMTEYVPWYGVDEDFSYDLGSGTRTTAYQIERAGSMGNIYRMDAVRASSMTITYDTYTAAKAKGAYVGEVQAPEGTYPDDGEQDGYWYVLIESGSGGNTNTVNYVEYIQSTGTQFIATEYVPNANTRVEMTFQLTTPDSTNQAIFGVAGQFSFRWYGTSGYFRTNGSNNVNFSASIDSSAKHTVVKTATKTTIDDTYSVNTTEATITLSLYLFGQHVSTGLQNPAKLKFWGCKIYESDVLLHDYRPCLDPDGVACVYDEVNNEYVYNAGSGTFAYGMAA